MQTVEDYTRAAESAARRISVAGRSAVHKVAVTQLYTAAAQLVIGIENEALLHISVCDIVGRIAVGDCEVGVYALNRELADLHHLGDLVCAFRRSIVLETDTSHTGIYLYMTAYRGRRICRKSQCVFGRNDALNDVVHRYFVCVFGRSIAENEYFCVGSIVPHSDRLIEIGHCEICDAAVLCEGADDVSIAVTVCVSLHDSHYFGSRRVERLDDVNVLSQL